MFDMIGMAPICVRAHREVQGSICECLTLPDNPRRTSGPIEVLDKIFPPILGRGKSGLNRAKNPVVWARLKIPVLIFFFYAPMQYLFLALPY